MRPVTDALLVRHPDLRRYMCARFLVAIATQVQTVAVGWQVYAPRATRSTWGWSASRSSCRSSMLILPAGHVADRYDRRRMHAPCVRCSLAVCAPRCSPPSLGGRDHGLPIFGVMVLFGIARAFSQPTGQALLPNLVPPEPFPHAVAVNSSLGRSRRSPARPSAALLVLFGVGVVYAASPSCSCRRRLLSSPACAAAGGGASREPMSWSTLLSGVRFVRSRPIVLGSISLDLFAVLFGGATALLPVFAGDILHVGPGRPRRAARGAGGRRRARRRRRSPSGRSAAASGRWMFGGVVAFGVATIVFGLSTSFLLSLAALAVLGAGDMVSVYIRHLLVQLETPDEIRGRVSAVNAVFIGASNELGEFESGVTAAWWGVVPAVVIGGVATLVVGGRLDGALPDPRQLDRFPDEPTAFERADVGR